MLPSHNLTNLQSLLDLPCCAAEVARVTLFHHNTHANHSPLFKTAAKSKEPVFVTLGKTWYTGGEELTGVVKMVLIPFIFLLFLLGFPDAHHIFFCRALYLLCSSAVANHLAVNRPEQPTVGCTVYRILILLILLFISHTICDRYLPLMKQRHHTEGHPKAGGIQLQECWPQNQG